MLRLEQNDQVSDTLHWESTRREIIDSYRDRIAQGDRLRLSQEDLSGLVEGFIALLKRSETAAETEGQIKALCEAEIQLLEEGYPQASVAKYVTVYRKAITAAIAAGVLVLSDQNSHRFIHQQRVTGLREERLEHWALTYLKYSPQIYESIDRRSQLVNRGKQLNLRLVRVERYLSLLRSFLEKKGSSEARWLGVAIAGLTGRRFSEVMAKGTFRLTNHPYLLHFEGQLKSRGERAEGYDIVTLFPATEVLDAIVRLRSLPTVNQIAQHTGKELSIALNIFNQKLNRVCNAALVGVVPPLEGKKSVSVHNLRSLYGAIAVYLFCPELQHDYAFVQHFLGHVMDSPATGHYFRFALCDNQGNLLRKKGILLNQVAPLPLEQETERPVPKTTPRKTRAQKEPHQQANQQANQQLSQQTKAQAALAEAASEDAGLASIPAVQKLQQAWQAEVCQQIASLRDEFEAQLQELRQESHAGWFVRRIEGLERENLQLRLERDKAIASVASEGKELERLKTEKALLAQELKQAQGKLDGFRRLLTEDEGVAAPQIGQADFAPNREESRTNRKSELQPKLEPELELELELELEPELETKLEQPSALPHSAPEVVGNQPRKQTQGNRRKKVSVGTVRAIAAQETPPLDFSPSAQHQPPNHQPPNHQSPEPQPPEPQSAPSDQTNHTELIPTAKQLETAALLEEAVLKAHAPKAKKAFQRAEAIFLAIKDWNRLNPFETFVVSPGLLETVFHVHRQAAKEFCEVFQNELWEYHQEIGVESPRWHNRGKDTQKLKSFVEKTDVEKA